MSKKEFEKYNKGEILINTKKHDGKTNSIGFCFLNLEDYTPEKALHFLSGIVSFDICAVFETDEILNETYGIYAKEIKSSGDIVKDLMNLLNNFNEKFTANEYCTTEYDNKKFKLIKYSEDIWSQWIPREEQKELKWKINSGGIYEGDRRIKNN